MKTLLRLGLRNLFRHRKRTLITALSIAAGVGVYIFMDSWLLGIERDSERNLVLYESSAGRIMDRSFWEERNYLPLDRCISDPGPLLRDLEDRGIPAVARISFSAEVILRQGPFPEDGAFPARIIALDPREDPRVFPLPSTLSQGGELRPGTGDALLGAWLAEDLDARPGSPLTLLARTRQGRLQTIDLEVRGILDSPNPFVNRGGIFIPRDTADLLLEMEGGVTEICLSLPLPRDSSLPPGELPGLYREAARLVDAHYPGLVFLDYKELSPEHTSLTRMKGLGGKLMGLLIFVIAAVGITNTMLTAVFERTREIGMMRALGMGNRQVRILLALEAAGIALLGSLAGLLVGSALTFWVVHWGIDYSFLLRGMDSGYRMTGLLKGMWNPRPLVIAPLLAVLGSVLVSWFPARRATGMGIAGSFRK